MATATTMRRVTRVTAVITAKRTSTVSVPLPSLFQCSIKISCINFPQFAVHSVNFEFVGGKQTLEPEKVY